jgi:hypothetical protein
MRQPKALEWRRLKFGLWPSTFTADEDFGNSLSNLGTTVAVTIYSMYLRLNLSTVLYLIQQPVISRQVSFVEFSTNLPEGPDRSEKLAIRMVTNISIHYVELFCIMFLIKASWRNTIRQNMWQYLGELLFPFWKECCKTFCPMSFVHTVTANPSLQW